MYTLDVYAGSIACRAQLTPPVGSWAPGHQLRPNSPLFNEMECGVVFAADWLYSCPMSIDKADGRAASTAQSGAGAGASSPVEFRLDPSSGVPAYLQLVHQVQRALRLGYLNPG